MCRDFCAGALKPRYDGGSPDIAGLPWPRRDLQKRLGYAMPNTVFATRGCRNNCDFCAVVGAKFGWHTRPVAEVAAEIAALKGSRFAFNDVSLCDASVSKIPYDGKFDLVAISIITGTAVEGYRLADHFRARGAKVVIGGVHATLLPDEAAAHADSVMTNPQVVQHS